MHWIQLFNDKVHFNPLHYFSSMDKLLQHLIYIIDLNVWLFYDNNLI